MTRSTEGPTHADLAASSADGAPVGVDDATADEAAAVLAHELRGPLAVVSGYLDLLRRAQDERTRAYALGAAQRAVARMDTLIDDVLKSVSAKREAESNLALVDPAVVIRSLLTEVPAYRSRVSFSNACGILARADETRLGRALSNVLDNALRFSPPETLVRVTLIEVNGCVRFIIEDEGPGIPSEDAERLRRRFERLDRDSALPGYGIGLSVTVELVEGMGGAVVLGNRPDGAGAHVELTLPGALQGSDI